MVNMAGFMGPNRTDKLWWFVRTAVVVTSLMMTFAMAMWITAIVETAWTLLAGPASGVGGVAVSLCGPGLLAAFVVKRMVRGQPLVDRGNASVALLTLTVLLGTAGYLVQRADSANGVLNLGDGLAHDPMVGMVCVTTAVAWAFAIVLCCIAWRAERVRSGQNREPVADRTALAGAALLIAVAVVMLHAAGSAVRLVLQMILEYTPPAIERRARLARVVTEVRTTDYFDHRLPIDLVPAFFLLVLTVLAMFIWLEYRTRKPASAENSANARAVKECAPSHLLLRDIHEFLARTGLFVMVGSIALTCAAVAAVRVTLRSSLTVEDIFGPFLIVLGIVGLLLLIAFVIRRPSGEATDRVRKVFGSFVDIAGFWAPDLHPLAGASYRLAVIRGLRRGISEVRKDASDKPIALVGHSQGAVICAWFIRGGHWEVQRSEEVSDEQALAMGLNNTFARQSDRIALFTCGSPLGSLYRTFFPRYFDDDFFRGASMASYGNIWHNYWRSTDPIAARLNRAAATDGKDGQMLDIDLTALPGEVAKGHCDYWQEDRIRRDIESYFGDFDSVGRTAHPSVGGNGVQRRLRGLRAAFPRLHLHGN